MPAGLLYTVSDSPTADGFRAGDLVVVYPGEKCRDNPTPGGRMRIVVVTDAEPEDIKQMLAGRFAGDGRRTGRSLWTLSPNLLPPAALIELNRVGRCEVTWADIIDVIANKDNGFTARVNGIEKVPRVR